MTKRKSPQEPERPSPLERMQSLKALGKKIKSESNLTITERLFLGGALIDIAGGKDPKECLNIKAKRGEKTGTEAKLAENKRRLAIFWVKKATSPVEAGGLGMTVEDAISLLCDQGVGVSALGYSEETLKNYWREFNADVDEIFTLYD